MKHDEGQRTRLPWWLYALDNTNAIVTTFTGCFVLYTRSAGAAYFATGAVLCSLTVKVLKRCVRQPRPVVTVNGKRKKTYGMPSTHSAVITYFATYIALACAKLPIHPSLPDSPALSRVLPALVAVPLAATIALSRIWLGHHTWAQVGAGCAYGLLFAPLWFRMWTGGLNAYGPMLEDMVRVYI
ncbi:PAP2-domain-containing protein [Polyporus arcularius HHB13444]|uniref:PAP2-domain-containing protein n=1 Tax=Polyporus arcularius HHB13444 TaxID=1314778 RepID=A0A5C3PAL9_9APHY|nr:PAP2-domain-containing protein [Polyporus arcularius HHB13444]